MRFLEVSKKETMLKDFKGSSRKYMQTKCFCCSTFKCYSYPTHALFNKCSLLRLYFQSTVMKYG